MTQDAIVFPSVPATSFLSGVWEESSQHKVQPGLERWLREAWTMLPTSAFWLTGVPITPVPGDPAYS